MHLDNPASLFYITPHSCLRHLIFFVAIRGTSHSLVAHLKESAELYIEMFHFIQGAEVVDRWSSNCCIFSCRTASLHLDTSASSKRAAHSHRCCRLLKKLLWSPSSLIQDQYSCHLSTFPTKYPHKMSQFTHSYSKSVTHFLSIFSSSLL